MKTLSRLFDLTEQLLTQAEHNLESIRSDFPEASDEKIKEISARRQEIDKRLREQKIRTLDFLGKLAEAAGVDRTEVQQGGRRWALIPMKYCGSNLKVFQLLQGTPTQWPSARIVSEEFFDEACAKLLEVIAIRFKNQVYLTSQHSEALKTIAEELQVFQQALPVAN